MAEVLLVNDLNFDLEVLGSNIPVVVDFFANWCGGCVTVLAALGDLAGSMDGKVKVVKVDVDESPSLPEKYNVLNIPSLLLFKNGEFITILSTGSKTLEQIMSSLQAHI